MRAHLGEQRKHTWLSGVAPETQAGSAAALAASAALAAEALGAPVAACGTAVAAAAAAAEKGLVCSKLPAAARRACFSGAFKGALSRRQAAAAAAAAAEAATSYADRCRVACSSCRSRPSPSRTSRKPRAAAAGPPPCSRLPTCRSSARCMLNECCQSQSRSQTAAGRAVQGSCSGALSRSRGTALERMRVSITSATKEVLDGGPVMQLMQQTATAACSGRQHAGATRINEQSPARTARSWGRGASRFTLECEVHTNLAKQSGKEHDASGGRSKGLRADSRRQAPRAAQGRGMHAGC